MTQVKRRYTTVRDGADWIVTAAFDESRLDSAHWFEAKVDAMNEATGEKYKFPPEIRTYKVGEIEHSFRQYVDIDFGGDREAAINHIMGTLFRRVYAYIERGH